MVRRFKHSSYDWVLVAMFFAILIIGWFVKVAATPAMSWSEVDVFSFRSDVGMQTFWTLGAALVFLSVLLIEKKFCNVFSFPIYLFCFFFLILLLFFVFV